MSIKIKRDDGIIRDITDIRYKIANNEVPVIIKYIYKGSQLIWSAVQNMISVFASGVWLNDQSWNNDDTWKNE